MSGRAAFVYDPALSRHVLRGDHPMRPIRLQHTYELLEAYGAFREGGVVEPRAATVEELASFHTREYIEAVKRFGRNEGLEEMSRFNFSLMGDNPIFPGIYEAAALSTGATMVAAEMIAEGKVRTAFNISGGLHHAAAGHASGFCVFNDPVVGHQVFYGSGDEGGVRGHRRASWGWGAGRFPTTRTPLLTISTHESGQFLFPGTGFADEIGVGAGRGVRGERAVVSVYGGRGVFVGVQRGG